MSFLLSKSEYADRLGRLEAERQTLAETVMAAERRATDEKLRVDDLQQQLKSAKALAESAKQELQDYKHKASRILQVRLSFGLKGIKYTQFHAQDSQPLTFFRFYLIRNTHLKLYPFLFKYVCRMTAVALFSAPINKI